MKIIRKKLFINSVVLTNILISTLRQMKWSTGYLRLNFKTWAPETEHLFPHLYFRAVWINISQKKTLLQLSQSGTLNICFFVSIPLREFSQWYRFTIQVGHKPSNVKNASLCQGDEYQEAIDIYLLTIIVNNSLFFCATIWILVTILDTQVKICPLASCQAYILTVVVTQPKTFTPGPLSWKLDHIYSWIMFLFWSKNSRFKSL